jgi:hypothetical protein
MPFIDESGVSCGVVSCKYNKGLEELRCKKEFEVTRMFPLIPQINYRTGKTYARGISVDVCPYYERDDGYTSEW